MSARRPVSIVLALLCVLVCALVAGAGSAGAATQFGSVGTGAGQFRGPWGVAVDQASGDVYVADQGNNRIDEFEASGGFVRAWGWGVLDGAQELQTCTTATTCRSGIQGNGPGQLEEGPMGIAVDNDPSSSSYEDVYVFDPSTHHVEKYDSSGKFLLEFEIKDFSYRGPVIAVGPGGRVYVGATAEVQVFEPSGVLSETISLASLSSISTEPEGNRGVSLLTVDTSGNVFLEYAGVPGLHEFEANGTEKATILGAMGGTATALAVDGSGDLFVGEVSLMDKPVTSRIIEYSPTGEELASFANELAGGGMAFAPGPDAGELYLITASILVVPVPVSGPPVVEPGSASAVGGRRGHATVKATLDAEGNPTTYRVEYVSEADFQANGYAEASSTPEVSLGKKLAQVPVSVELSGLVPGGVYHYRVVASSAKGSESSPDQTVETVPPALIDGPWMTSVADTSATFAAEIDPLGVYTEYSIEYGRTTAYGETLSGSVGEGEAYLPISFHRQGLSPDTVYHYRLVVRNEVGVYATADHTFVTQASSAEGAGLPDGRVWELVSPPNKKGALIAVKPSEEPYQTAPSGNAIAYQASEPIGEDVAGRSALDSVILSERGPDGWISRDVTAPNPFVSGYGWSNGDRSNVELRVFSTDLSAGVYEPERDNDGGSPLSSEATERTLYLRGEPNGAFLPLESPADVAPGTKFDDEFMDFQTATPDLSHVIFSSHYALTREAIETPLKGIEEKNPFAYSVNNYMYEWSGGKLQLVNIGPGTPAHPNGERELESNLGELASTGGYVAHAISSDGRWVVWSSGELFPFGPGAGVNTSGITLYVRDMVEGKTFSLGGKFARFETMSSDGSRVFFAESAQGQGGDLYVFETATDTLKDITADHPGEANAGVQNAVMGASEDGSYVYFVATGVLANGATKGADNVYVVHDLEGTWTTSYIATLSGQDSKSWRGDGDGQEFPTVESSAGVVPELVSARVSPNGRYLAFMSERSLTGYDNRDAVSGQPDEEVYLYDAATGRLACASCNPTGARPVGVFDDPSAAPLFADLRGVWSHTEGAGDHWLAGSVPGWVHTTGQTDGVARGLYQPRYLSNSGRLFFDSPDALVPQDTNGLEDAYEYEPAGVGSCTSVSATFSERSQGCVSLISSGHASSESIFVDASENGSDVFFATNEKLVNEDYDTAYDIYDAHVCSSEAPCHPEASVSPPACTSGDACKAAPSPQPEIFGPAPSATFSGVGNVIEEAKPVVKSKAKVKPRKRKSKAKKKHSKQSKRKPKQAVRVRSGRASGKGR